MAKRKLLVEGWRFLPHSYAIVNQWQLLALCRHPEIELRVRDLPRYMPSWKSDSALMDRDQEAALRALLPAEPDFMPDVTLRIAFPFDLSPAPVGRTVVFCTSEYQVYQKENWTGCAVDRHLAARQDLTVITPSHWSAEGLQRSGIPADKIRIVPHGVNTKTFAKLALAAPRQGAPGSVVFMNASAMTVNKGVDLLLRAFAELCRQRHDCYLLLKGSDELYRSNARLNMALQAVAPELRQATAARIRYGGATVTTREMAALYRNADVYVSPYRAEGFNLPVLEAMASGLPVICTSGGPTEDFVGDDNGVKIPSRREPAALPNAVEGVHLQPDLQHLIAAMAKAATDGNWRRQAGTAGRRQAEKFSWDDAVERLLEVLF